MIMIMSYPVITKYASIILLESIRELERWEDTMERNFGVLVVESVLVVERVGIEVINGDMTCMREDDRDQSGISACKGIRIW